MRTSPDRSESVFLLLAALFVAALVSCNLIANKFVFVNVIGFADPFKVSAGILPYPLTFLVTDILSEVYGRVRANLVVAIGFFASLFVLFVLWLGDQFPAIAGSPVDDDTYRQVFANAWRVIGASMIAYVTAQFIDIRIFHFWKRVTKGRHLWLRNNISTIGSQFVDTALVVCVLFVGEMTAAEIWNLILAGWIFKMLMALLDTPVCYAAIAALRGLGIEPAPHDE